MPERQLPIAEILTLLSETPERIAALTADLSPAQLRASPAPDEWSATEVLAHLRACADVWGGCIQRIITEDAATLRAINPRTWIKQTDYPELDFHPSLDAFTAQRAALLALLEPLPAEAWSRSATVTGAGKPLTRTVHTYAQWLARHERPHVKQIANTVTTMNL
ncbi:MAG TPA: DinB family protein [Thermomicrobiaceae bacterium]|nr:DinB family protein [Thermomicrobiaceae bacterium]